MISSMKNVIMNFLHYRNIVKNNKWAELITREDFYHSTVLTELIFKTFVNQNFFTQKIDKMNIYKIILTNNEPINKFQ